MSPVENERLRRILAVAALAVFMVLLFQVVAPFGKALAWSAVLVLSLWPVYRRVRQSATRAAPLLMTLLVTLGIVVPVGVIGWFLTGEVDRLGRDVGEILTGRRGAELVEDLKQVPAIGGMLSRHLADLRTHPDLIQGWMDDNTNLLFGIARSVLGAISAGVFKLLVCLFAAYFLFRNGEEIAGQIRRGVTRLGGDRMNSLLQHIRETVRGVVYGLVMTAIAQAILASFGFWVAGVGYPLLLGALTLIFSFIPFGPPIIWVPAALSLFAKGEVFWGVLCFLWGMFVISTMDNILRPIFIGQATQMPVLLVFIGVIGGILAFGMLGLFLGPVLVAVALAFWRDWIAWAGAAAEQT